MYEREEGKANSVWLYSQSQSWKDKQRGIIIIHLNNILIRILWTVKGNTSFNNICLKGDIHFINSNKKLDFKMKKKLGESDTNTRDS